MKTGIFHDEDGGLYAIDEAYVAFNSISDIDALDKFMSDNAIMLPQGVDVATMITASQLIATKFNLNGKVEVKQYFQHPGQLHFIFHDNYYASKNIHENTRPIDFLKAYQGTCSCSR